MPRSTRTSRRRAWWTLASLLVPISLLYGCIVDHACDANEVELKSSFSGCLCAPGAVLNADKSGCVACGENEEIQNGVCACMTGFARASADAGCSASSQGSACSATTPCNGADFPYCSPAGYCTLSGCSTDADCTVGGYACDTTASPAYCVRPPSGQGKTCSASADCAGFEADYCAMGTCLVSGCKTTTTCFGDWACCDFAVYGLADVCLAPGQLDSSGNCPGTGAAPVKR